MPLTLEKTAQHDVDPAAFRLALPVTQLILFPNGSCYPICPRCGCSLDREYLNYCNSCGQHMRWETFGKAEIRRWRKPEE